MPVYATYAQMQAIYGFDQIGETADLNTDGLPDKSAADAALIRASHYIESFAAAFGVVPSGAADALATAGTYPGWWTDAAIDIAVHFLSLDAGPQTKEKRKRFEDWRADLMAHYPQTVSDRQITIASTFTPAFEGNERRFSRSKLDGLL